MATDDIVNRLRDWAFGTWSPPVKPLMIEAADEIEQLRKWKDLAYEMRNSAWWMLRRKYLKRFDELHREDWKAIRNG